MSTLSQFMDAHRVTSGTYTHNAFGHPGFQGKYNIPLDERKLFSELAAKAAFGPTKTKFCLNEVYSIYQELKMQLPNRIQIRVPTS